MIHLSRTILALAPALALLAGCGGSEDGTPSKTATEDPLAPILAAIVPTDPPPLPEKLDEFARLIAGGRTGPARIRIKKHLVLKPGDARAHFLFGLSYHREMKYAQAREWYQKALTLDSTYAPIHHFDGWAAFYLAELDEARRSFRIHLAYQPREADSHFGLGVVELEEGNLDKADGHLRDSIDLLAGNPRAAKGVSKARSRLGDINMQRGDLEPAGDEYAKAVEIFPDHYETWNKLAQVYERMDMTEEAAAARQGFLEARARVRPELGDAPVGEPGQ